MSNYLYALLPLLPSLGIVLRMGSVRLWMWQSLALSVVGYFLTDSLIPGVGELNKKAGLWGKDLGKKGRAVGGGEY